MKKTMLAVAISVLSFQSIAGSTAEYPGKNTTVRVVIPYGPGGGVDAAFRIFQKYASSKNVTVVPDYRPGARALIGIRHASEQDPDGRTLLMTIISDIPRHNFEENFSYISAISTTPITLLASKNSNITSIGNVVKIESTTPGKLNWAASSIPMERAIVSFAETNKIDFEKITVVPFKGGGEMLKNLASGVVDLGYLPAGIAMPLVKENKITLVHTNSVNPNDINDGFGLFIPKGDNKNITDFWIKFADSFFNDQEIKKDLENAYLITVPTGPGFLSNIIRNWKNK